MHKKAYRQLRAFRKTLGLVHGSYALALLDNEDAETIYVAKNKSPLLVGVGEDLTLLLRMQWQCYK